MKYRIGHPDKYNWTIEEFQEGGEIAQRGRTAGQPLQARWKAPQEFHPSLKRAALALLDKAAGDALLEGEAKSILEALELAEKRVLATLAAVEPEVKA